MTGEKPTFPWHYLLILAGIEFLQDGLSKTRSLIWNTVQHNINREAKVSINNFHTKFTLKSNTHGHQVLENNNTLRTQKILLEMTNKTPIEIKTINI